MKSNETGARVGRPRAFNPEEALDQAMQVFWRKGYDGASLSDLTEAMGINRPSLYAAFGNKEALYRRVLERYANGPASYLSEALCAPTAHAVAERVLYGNLELISASCPSLGCLAVRGVFSTGEEATAIHEDLRASRVVTQTLLRERFERAITEGDLPTDVDAAALALYLTTVSHGMAVQAAAGATPEELRQVVATVLRAWPGGRPG